MADQDSWKGRSSAMRRCSPLFYLVLILASRGVAEDLLADLRAEVAAVVASASVRCSESVKGDGGPMVRNCALKLNGESASYELSYKSFLPPNHARNRSELNDWASGLGMIQPSIHGWYSNGFVEVSLSNSKSVANTADWCGSARLVRESGKVVAGDFAWDLPTGQVVLRFFLLADRAELFLQVSARPTIPDSRIQVSFRCYPGGFQGPFDRVVHTALQQFANDGPKDVALRIDPQKEPWMLLADHYAGVTPRPMGPCSIAAAPEDIESASATIKRNYSILPTYALAPGKTSARFAIREFPPISWQSAKAEVAATSEEALAAAREALKLLPPLHE